MEPAQAQCAARRLGAREVLSRFALVVGSALLTLAGVEAGLALFHPVPFSIEHNMYFVADPYTGFRLMPNSIGSFHDGIPARANRNGHRNPDVSLAKPPGVFRIVAVGDSFTLGAGVREAEAWPRLVERKLTTLVRRSIQVVDTAVGGWGPYQYRQSFEHDGSRFDPDLVLVGFFVGNDTYASTRPEDTRTAVAGRRVSRAARRETAIGTRLWLYEHFNLARLALGKGPVLTNFTRANCTDFTAQYLSIQSGRLRNHLVETVALAGQAQSNVDQIVTIARLAGVPVVVVLIPDENQLNAGLRARIVRDESRYDWRMPQSMLIGQFERAHLAVIDLLPAFRENGRCLYMNDTHWTPEGHALAAGVVARRLLPRVEHSPDPAARDRRRAGGRA